MKPWHMIGALAAILALTGPASAVSRVWVSGKGTDTSGCGPITSPCRTLQYAHDTVDTDGEIDVLDSAGYGAVNITKGVTIINDGGGTAGVLAPSGQDGVQINASPTTVVTLRGLTIEGSGVGRNGISVSLVGSLIISETSIFGFTNEGLYFAPVNGPGLDSKLFFSGKSYANTADCIVIRPFNGTRVFATISKSLISQCDNGVNADASNSRLGFVRTTVADTVVHYIPGAGLAVVGNNGGSTMMVDHSTLTHTYTGLSANGPGAAIDLYLSTISQVTNVATTANTGTVSSFGNNGIDFFQTFGPVTTTSLR